MGWISIDKINDNEKIAKGASVRFYNTAKAIEEQCALPCGIDGHLDYIITQIYDNNEYFQLTCISQGEIGNITCVFQRDNGAYYVTGKEIKRMLLSDLYNVFIHKTPSVVLE